MAFSSGLSGHLAAMDSLSPRAQRDKKWAETARGMEVAKYASTMKKNRLANEKAEIDLARAKARDEAMAGYDKGLAVQGKVEEFLSNPELSAMNPADRQALVMKKAAELPTPEQQEAFFQAAQSGDFQTGDKNLDAAAERMNRTFGTDIDRGEKGMYMTKTGEVAYTRES